MKTYKERTSGILEKVNKKKARRRAIRVSVGCVILTLAIVLFTPYDTNPPSTDQYAKNEYYQVIDKINAFTYEKPSYDNLFEEIIEDSFIQDAVGGNMDTSGIPEFEVGAPSGTGPQPGENYEETTDNQVAGVIEGDRIKRSDKYIYYLRQDKLTVYSIAGADSKEVGSFTIENKDSYKLAAYMHEWEMFLSRDCKTITLIASDYMPDTSTKYVVLISIDVSDPANIKENARTYLTGSYLSARSINGSLLLMANYAPRHHAINFDNPKTFVPQYGAWNKMTCIAGANIVAPDELTNINYTVICQLDEKTLEAKSTGAFLSFANDIYVSENHIFATRSFTEHTTEDALTRRTSMTEIAALHYSEEGLKYAGSAIVEGYVENQYSMDEYDNILRIVTTTNVFYQYDHSKDEISDMIYVETVQKPDSGTNASLYCIDLNTWKVIASVEHFAPKGETVRSVRFDKTNAYVCTAVQLTDPVFYFDLSDLNNIKVKDTGTITGYSHALVNFGDYLLGIGYGDNMDVLKIELYQETADGVASVGVYEVFPCFFSNEYKSYLIDRTNMRIGLGYTTLTGDFADCYVLLQFDGYEFVELVKENIYGENNLKRAVIIDGYLYMFGNNFAVREI